jgi:hypothetical protein
VKVTWTVRLSSATTLSTSESWGNTPPRGGLLVGEDQVVGGEGLAVRPEEALPQANGQHAAVGGDAAAGAGGDPGGQFGPDFQPVIHPPQADQEEILERAGRPGAGL